MKGRDQHNGDRGQTSLADGTRVPKSSPRIAALCAIDELNAALGVARASCDDAGTREVLASLQRDLLALGARMARPAPDRAAAGAKADWSSARLDRIDDLSDTVEARLPGLSAFVLPGGGRTGAALHAARAVCRRAECAAFALAGQEKSVDPSALAYLNRLSDLLFALARAENQRQGATDEAW
jgi:cob(I)alamin adenosyltransferase